MKNKNLISYLAILFLNIFNNIKLFANDELIKAKNEWIRRHPMIMHYIQNDVDKQFRKYTSLLCGDKYLSILILEGHDINCLFDRLKNIVKKYGAFIKDEYIRTFCESFEGRDYPVSEVINVLKDEINIIKNHRESCKSNKGYYQDINLYTNIVKMQKNIELRLSAAQFFINGVGNIKIRDKKVHISSNSNIGEILLVLEQFKWEENILKKYVQHSLALFESYEQINFLEEFSQVTGQDNCLLSRKFQAIINSLEDKLDKMILKELQSVLPNLQPII